MTTSNLIVEDGSGVTRANAYVDVATVDAYFLVRNESSWIGTKSEKEAAIIKGTQYIDGKYRNRWKGVKVSAIQSLTWPRVAVNVEDASYTANFSRFAYSGGEAYTSTLPDNIIPQELKDATCEAALRSMSSTLAEDLSSGVKSRSIAGAITTEYANHSGDAIKIYQAIDQLLSGLLKKSNEAQRG